MEVVTEWYANQRDRDYVLVFNSEIEILNGNYIRVDTITENKSNYINDELRQQFRFANIARGKRI